MLTSLPVANYRYLSLGVSWLRGREHEVVLCYSSLASILGRPLILGLTGGSLSVILCLPKWQGSSGGLGPGQFPDPSARVEGFACLLSPFTCALGTSVLLTFPQWLNAFVS